MIDTLVKKGRIILLSEGTYSDYGIGMVAKAKIDFDIKEADQLRKEVTEMDLPMWLIQQGYIEELDYDEFDIDCLEQGKI